MNINDLSNSNEKIIETLDNVALKIKAENRLAELDKKSEEVIKTLEKFSEKIPIMIDRIEVINKELKLEEFKNTLLNIEKNSSDSLNINKNIENLNENTVKKLCLTAEEQIALISEKANKNMNKREYFYYLLDKSILVIFITAFIINIAMIFFYKKQLSQINYEFNRIHNILMNNEKYWIYEFNRIHNILMNNEKYWIDKDNFDIFIKHNKNSH